MNNKAFATVVGAWLAGCSQASEVPVDSGKGSGGEAADASGGDEVGDRPRDGGNVGDGDGESIGIVATCQLPALPTAGTINLSADVAYKTLEGQTLRLDIAWPKTTALHPLVVTVHGGGWWQGDKM